MKKNQKMIAVVLALCALLALGACGGGGQAEDSAFVWTREGYFTDENDNLLYVLPSEDESEPGWTVGCFLDGEPHGWIIQQEGETLHGNLTAEDLDEPDFYVTVSEEGEDGLLLTLENGDVYHFTPVPEEMKASISILINTEGLGQIAYAEEGEALEFDDEFPAQSAVVNLAEPATYLLGAKADEGWSFVKWTKDGEDFSTDEQITVEFSESAEYIAVFEFVE